jgi:hypothetical protein
MSHVHEISIEIGGLPVRLRTTDPSFRTLVADRYAGFIGGSAKAKLEFDVDVVPSCQELLSDDDVSVRLLGSEWHLRRGDFHAKWDPAAGRGSIRQTANPYSIDSVLRIVHTLLLAREGGFLLHAASVIRNGRAFLFSGVSGAGKTTLSRLVPADAHLLTDEISYVRRTKHGYDACGTPFTGELAKVGENLSAPIAGLFFLAKGAENSIEPVATSEAMRRLLRNILFFAEDAQLVEMVFRTACKFVEQVPVKRLTFFPDQRVWELIR